MPEIQRWDKIKSTCPQAERYVQTDSTDQGGNIQVAQGAIQVCAALTLEL